MNQLLEVFITHGLLLDAAGAIGLGLLSLAAIKLARRNRSWGGSMMAIGAILLLVARLYLILSPHFVDNAFLYMIGPVGISMTIGLPPLLLAFGLAGVVWGLWGHERWLSEDGR